MGIKFNGQDFPGIVEQGFAVPAPMRKAAVEVYPGVDGASSIVMGLGPRTIAVPVLCFDRSFTTREILQGLLIQLDEKLRVAEVGDLEVPTAEGRTNTIPKCEFINWQQRGEILPDVGGCLIPDFPTQIYFVPLTLFYQQLGYTGEKKKNR